LSGSPAPVLPGGGLAGDANPLLGLRPRRSLLRGEPALGLLLHAGLGVGLHLGECILDLRVRLGLQAAQLGVELLRRVLLQPRLLLDEPRLRALYPPPGGPEVPSQSLAAAPSTRSPAASICAAISSSRLWAALAAWVAASRSRL